MIGTNCGDFCVGYRPAIDIPLMVGGGVTTILGTTLMVVGANRRSRYLDWRRGRGEVALAPSGWAGRRGFGVGVRGAF